MQGMIDGGSLYTFYTYSIKGVKNGVKKKCRKIKAFKHTFTPFTPFLYINT